MGLVADASQLDAARRQGVGALARFFAGSLHRSAYARVVRLAILLILATGCGGFTHARWASRFPSPSSREASSVAVVPGGGVVVAGCSQPVNGVPASPWVAQLDAAGREVWARALDAPSCLKPYVTSDGATVVVADGAERRSGSDSRGHVWALALDGRTQWTVPIEGTGGVIASASMARGEVTVCGTWMGELRIDGGRLLASEEHSLADGPFAAGSGRDGRALRLRRKSCERDDLATWQAKLRCDESHGLCHAALTAMAVRDGWVALLGSVYAPHGPVRLGEHEVAPAGSHGPLYVAIEQATGRVVASGVLPDHFLATSITAERGLTFVAGNFSRPLDLGARTWTPRVLHAYCDPRLPHGGGEHPPPCDRGDRLRRAVRYRGGRRRVRVVNPESGASHLARHVSRPPRQRRPFV
jgi:hypothetical protein